MEAINNDKRGILPEEESNTHMETTQNKEHNNCQAENTEERMETTPKKGYNFKTKYPALKSDQCPLCKLLIREIVELPCGDGFCRDCLRAREEQQRYETVSSEMKNFSRHFLCSIKPLI